MSSGIESYVSAAMKIRIMNGDIPRWILKHKRCAYIRDSYLAAPLWVKRAEFKALRELATRLTASTGIRHVLDHIVPVSHPYVSGLNVPWNVQVIPHAVNAAKSNQWHPDQLEFEL